MRILNRHKRVRWLHFAHSGSNIYAETNSNEANPFIFLNNNSHRTLLLCLDDLNEIGNKFSPNMHLNNMLYLLVEFSDVKNASAEPFVKSEIPFVKVCWTA